MNKLKTACFKHNKCVRVEYIIQTHAGIQYCCAIYCKKNGLANICIKPFSNCEIKNVMFFFFLATDFNQILIDLQFREKKKIVRYKLRILILFLVILQFKSCS